MKKFIVSIVVVILIACAGVGAYYFGGQYFGGDSVKADTTEVVTDSIVSDSLVVDSVAVDTIAIWTPWTLTKFYVRGCKINHEYFKGLWCNGNTSDFGPDIPSSNLGRPTKIFELF